MEAARVRSRIVGVTVYREGARIRRIAEIAPAGERYPAGICVTGLPLSMRDASVRVSVEAAGDDESGELPVAADVRVTLDVPDDEEDLAPPVDEEREAAARAVKALDSQIAQVKRELARVQRLTLAPRPKPVGAGEALAPPPDSPTMARLALLDMRRQRERLLRDELAELQEHYRAAVRTAKKLNDRYMRATTARQADQHELRKAVVISLGESPTPMESEGQGEGGEAEGKPAASRAHLVLSYTVPGARWAPAYSVRMDHDGTGKAAFAMRAVVAQNTGEDWNGVALALSTADAQGWSELPELASIRIGRRQPPVRKAGWRPPPSGAELLYGDYDRAFFRLMPSAVPQQAASFEEEREITTPLRPYAASFASADRDTLEYMRVGDDDSVESGDFGDEDTPTRDLSEMRARMMAPGAQPAAEMPPAPPLSAPSPMPARAQKRNSSSLFAARRSLRRTTAKTAAPPPAMRPSPSGRGFDENATLEEQPASGHGYGDVAFGGAASFERSGALPADRPGRPRKQETGNLGDLGSGAESNMLLAYSDLRMLSASSSMRGALRPAQPAELYLEFMFRRRIEVAFDVFAAISTAERRAGAVAHLSLPSGHHPVRADYYDYVYTADTVAYVPSDGTFHSLPLRSRDADVATRYVVVPRESTDVFRVAEVANPLGSPILAGPIDVYMGKDFLLTSEVSFTPPSGTLRLGLGVEQAIKVSRNTSYREETAGLMRGSLSLKHQIRIEVQNNLDRAIECDVRERIPAIREDEEDVEVNVESSSPQWQPYEPDPGESPAEAGLKGGYSWRTRVAAGQKTAFSADYAIKISAKNELVGGNRREV